ncbi:MAG: Uma2 family endonuclease [Terriglobia bacterium]
MSPDLAIEIVSKNDRGDDLLLKVFQCLEAGAKAVWLMYPNTRLAYRYIPGKREPEVRAAEAGDKFEEPELLPGFSLSLSAILG